MNVLLRVSGLIDGLNSVVGRIVYWLVLAAVLISSGNAVMRYASDISSNAWLELQWYLFSAVFLLCSGYTLLRYEHIRIDIVASRFSARGQAWIDVFGILVFLLPVAILILGLSIPMVREAYIRHEISSNAGGLLRWPVKALMPAGFALLVLQAVSELIKRVAFLTGHAPDHHAVHHDQAQQVAAGEPI